VGIIYNQKDLTTREYPRGRWEGAVSITKARNGFRKEGLELVSGRNRKVNNVLEGCTGFVRGPSGKLAYFCLDAAGPFGRCYYRTAKHDKDYQGGNNHFCHPDDIYAAVRDLLQRGY